ncbi:MAG TPA: thioredoxin domain-containing protein [Polyangiaceae bacterium]|nr:thioredoxin domain-containing protein [Polyangiaceae bacterium]
MFEHIPSIVRDLKKMEATERPWSAALKAALTTGPGPEFGPKDSVVQLVEFSDFESPLCTQDANVVQQIRARYGSRVHFVFHQYSEREHTKPHAAAEAALAAHDQGKFWEYYGRLCAASQVLDRPALEKEAGKIGLDLNRFRKALDERTFERQVDADFALAEELWLPTPTTLFVNGKPFGSPLDFHEIGYAIRAIILDAD